MKLEKTIFFSDLNFKVFISLEDTDMGSVFGMSGYYKGSCGQIFGSKEVRELAESNEEFRMLLTWWDNYRNNHMHGGTPEQEKEVKRVFEDFGWTFNYETACNHLTSVGLYEVPAEKANPYRVKPTDTPYRYGSEWLFYPIPASVVKSMKDYITKR